MISQRAFSVQTARESGPALTNRPVPSVSCATVLELCYTLGHHPFPLLANESNIKGFGFGSSHRLIHSGASKDFSPVSLV
jgi:hypothetical protein